MILENSVSLPSSTTEANKPAGLLAGAANGSISELGRRRLEKFAALMPRVIVTDDAETIHDVRVWSRRLQQILTMLAPRSAKKNKPRKLARSMRRIRRILGRPRNLDVMTQLVEERIGAASNPVVRDAWDHLRVHLADRRGRAVERSREKLRDFDLVNFAARARALIDGAGDALEESFTESVAGALADWRAAIETAKAQPGTEEVHALRIAGKRLRYRVELLAELGHGPAKSWVKSLRLLQDQLGAWHDRQVLLETCAKFLSQKDFLASHPGLARALLVEMERERRRANGAVDGLVKHAEKASGAFGETEFATGEITPPAGEEP
jgi:CHAD domain-containing protein